MQVDVERGWRSKLAKNLQQVEEVAGQIIGMQLVTPQLLQKVKVHKVLVAEDVYYPGESETSEFYVSVLLNRATGRNMIMYSTEGGMDIEEETYASFNLQKKLILLLDFKVFKQEQLFLI
jgi:succinyl-CoA synthetase beta subunit